MDYVWEIFRELRDRAKTPLIATFVIAWMLINWQILFFTFIESFPESDPCRRICHIEQHISNNLNGDTFFCSWLFSTKLFIAPLLSTVFLLTIFQPIKSFSGWPAEYFSKLSQGAFNYLRGIKSISQDVLDHEKALRVQASKQAREIAGELETAIAELQGNRLKLKDYASLETKYKLSTDKEGHLNRNIEEKNKEIDELKKEVRAEKNSVINFRNRIIEFEGKEILSRLGGRWYNNHTYNKTKVEGYETAYFEGNEYYAYDKTNKRQKIADIGYISFNSANRELVFFKILVDERAWVNNNIVPHRGKVLVNRLYVNNDWTEMTGVEDESITIIYSRVAMKGIDEMEISDLTDRYFAGYDLKGRSISTKPLITQEVTDQGKVIVKIVVDIYGKVIKATAGERGTTAVSRTLLAIAEEAARKTKFDANPNAPDEQIGTMTFVFSLLR